MYMEPIKNFLQCKYYAGVNALKTHEEQMRSATSSGCYGRILITWSTKVFSIELRGLRYVSEVAVNVGHDGRRKYH